MRSMRSLFSNDRGISGLRQRSLCQNSKQFFFRLRSRLMLPLSENQSTFQCRLYLPLCRQAGLIPPIRLSPDVDRGPDRAGCHCQPCAGTCGLIPVSLQQARLASRRRHGHPARVQDAGGASREGSGAQSLFRSSVHVPGTTRRTVEDDEVRSTERVPDPVSDRRF